MATPNLNLLKGRFFPLPNGSVGAIRRIAQRLAEHAIVEIVNPQGHHKKGDEIVWPIPAAMIASLSRADKAAA